MVPIPPPTPPSPSLAGRGSLAGDPPVDPQATTAKTAKIGTTLIWGIPGNINWVKEKKEKGWREATTEEISARDVEKKELSKAAPKKEPSPGQPKKGEIQFHGHSYIVTFYRGDELAKDLQPGEQPEAWKRSADKVMELMNTLYTSEGHPLISRESSTTISFAKDREAVYETESNKDIKLKNEEEAKADIAKTGELIEADVARVSSAETITTRGLPNLGSTCYMNATLISFFHNPRYSQLLEPNHALKKEQNESKKDYQARQTLQTTLKAVSEEIRQPAPNLDTLEANLHIILAQMNLITPKIKKEDAITGKFTEHDAFELGTEHDAQEFLNSLLTALKPERDTQILTHTQIELNQDKEKIIVSNNATDISPFLHIPLNPNQPSLQKLVNNVPSDNVHYEKKDSRYFFDFPNNSSDPSINAKQYHYLDASSTPQSLFVHLNAFNPDRSKNLTQIDIPETLELPLHTFDSTTALKPPTKTQKQIMHINSIVLHKGFSSTSGHYATLVRTGDTWQLFNDKIVEDITQDIYTTLLERKIKEINQTPKTDRTLQVKQQLQFFTNLKNNIPTDPLELALAYAKISLGSVSETEAGQVTPYLLDYSVASITKTPDELTAAALPSTKLTSTSVITELEKALETKKTKKITTPSLDAALKAVVDALKATEATEAELTAAKAALEATNALDTDTKEEKVTAALKAAVTALRETKFTQETDALDTLANALDADTKEAAAKAAKAALKAAEKPGTSLPHAIAIAIAAIEIYYLQ